MALAKFRKVYGKNGSGRFVISEGPAPSTYLLPHEALPTLYTDLEDNRFEIVITKGTLITVVADANGDSRLVPANGTATPQVYSDGGATPVTVTVPAWTPAIGAAQYDLYRPFDKGTSQGAGWIVEAFVEWPMIQGLNDNLVPVSPIKPDAIGRPVLWNSGDMDWVRMGKVIEVEKFALNFDDGMLSYMLLPSDPGALKLVYELTQAGPYVGKLGIRANLDVANVIGSIHCAIHCV